MGRKRISNEVELTRLMNKTCKGFVTELTKHSKKVLKEHVRDDLYGKKLVNTHKTTYSNKYGFLNSISIMGTSKNDDSYDNSLYFDQGYLENLETKKTADALGTYTDVYGVSVVRELVESLWIENGTDDMGTDDFDFDGSRRYSLVPRAGSNMIKNTIAELDGMLAGNDFNHIITSELGDVVIERFR